MENPLLSYQHISILATECADLLDITHKKRHIDATLGLGGHAEYFLQQNPDLSLIGIDQDPFARTIAAKRLNPWQKNVQIIADNFSAIAQCRSFIPQSILFDIGVSSLQFDMPERGFSYRFEAPLDMRMNPQNPLTAADIVNTYDIETLTKIFREYGEEPRSWHIANAIVQARTIAPFRTTLELSDCIEKSNTFYARNGKNAGGNASALCFQALRIAVNKELEVLETALHDAIDILEVGGRIAVISFHSLEDRIVKNVFSSYFQKEKRQKYALQKSQGQKVGLISINKKPISPTLQEIEKNPRSRSAKLRVVEKIFL